MYVYTLDIQCKKKKVVLLSHSLFNAFFLSFFFFSAPLTALANDLSDNGRFLPTAVAPLTLSLVSSVQLLSVANVRELSPVAVCENDEADDDDDDFGGLAWISVIIRA